MLVFYAAAPACAWEPNAQELDIANRMANASGQRRALLTFDPILSQVARERAADMAKRGYFDHINPDGHGANYLVRKAGYVLPSSYPSDGNNLESIAAGGSTAATTWSDWMGSPDHKKHLLGEISFFAVQTAYGIGYYEAAGSQYRHYWVVITAPPMPNPAAITISSPAGDEDVPEGAIIVVGTTSGSQAAASVQVLLENAGGSTAWRTASGTKSWSISLTDLSPGSNSLHARSLSPSGVVLAEAAIGFRYVVMRPVNVHVQGSGSVGAFAGTTSLRVGESYTILATPAAGWLFSGWSGSWSGIRPRATFTVRAGMDATATFVPNPFIARRGGYSALIGDALSPGLLRLQLDAFGRFSAGLFVAGRGYAAQGRFGLDGKAEVAIPRLGSTPLQLTLAFSGTNQLNGSIASPGGTTSFNLTPALRGGAALASLAGRYTVALPADSANTDPGIPKGSGYGVLLVESSGSATLTAALADGTIFSRGGWIDTNGRLAFYTPLYNNGGAMSGVIAFGSAQQSDLTGALRWSKPQRAGATYFPRAFDTTIASVGGRYTPPPAGRPVMTVSSANANLRLVIGAGNLASEVAQNANLGESNLVSIAAPVFPGITVSIDVRSGGFSGTFTHPATGAGTRFRGVILQKGNAGSGFFPGIDQSGYVSLVPMQ